MGLDISTAATVELLRAYDDYPDGKLDVFEFDTLVRDLNRVLGRGPGGGAMGTMSGPRPSASVRAAFDRFDRNRQFLDYRELRSALTHMGLDLSTSTAVELVRAYDDYPDGKLDIFEFSNLVRDLGAAPPPRRRGATPPPRRGATPPRPGAPSAKVRSAFDHFDKNRSGYLDYRELRNALRRMGFDVSTRTAIDAARVRRSPGRQARRPRIRQPRPRPQRRAADGGGQRRVAAAEERRGAVPVAAARCRRRHIRAGCRARSARCSAGAWRRSRRGSAASASRTSSAPSARRRSTARRSSSSRRRRCA